MSTEIASLAVDRRELSLARLNRLVEQSYRLSDAGVAYERIQARAIVDGISFNEALEVVYKERFDAQTP